MSFSETEIEFMNQRLSVIQRMRRRFGGSVEAALALMAEYREKLEFISDSSEVLSSLEKKVEEKRKELLKKGEILTAKRKEGAFLYPNQ